MSRRAPSSSPAIPKKNVQRMRMRTVFFHLGIAALGMVATVVAMQYADAASRASLLRRAETIAAGIPDHVLREELTGTRQDIGTHFYTDFKGRLMNIRKANPDVRFVYVLGFREGKPFFYADSETPGSKDESLPGDIYTDASDFKIRQSMAGIPFVEGPYQDVWGSWVSGYAPIFEASSSTIDGRGKLLGTVGVDIPFLAWMESRIYAATLPLLITLLLEVVWFFVHQANKRRMVHMEAVESEKRKLDIILKHLPIGVLVAEAPSGNAVISNPMATRILGRAIVNVPAKERIPETYQIEHEDGTLFPFTDLPLAITLASGKPSTRSDIVIRKPGGIRTNIRSSSVPILNETGKMAYAVVVIEDITREREIDNMKSEFVSIASHQLRTPLTGIKWLAELLVDDPGRTLDKRQKKQAKQIADSNERMIALVDDLLSVSRIERGKKFSIVKKPTNLTELLEVLLADMRGLAEAHHQKIVVDPSWPKTLLFSVDAEKIRQVLQNLLANAIKYSPERTRITIGYAIDSKKNATFSVKDQGIGIPASQQKRIFEKFFRAENAQTAETSGNGLGLYIAKAIVEGHGGKIWFESTEGKGTTFFFTLRAS